MPFFMFPLKEIKKQIFVALTEKNFVLCVFSNTNFNIPKFNVLKYQIINIVSLFGNIHHSPKMWSNPGWDKLRL